MKNKIALVTLVLLLLMPAFLQAKPVNPHKAHLVADHFFKAIGQKQRALQDITSRTPYTQFYIFAAPQGEGFVLVAADDCVVPILGYSTKGTFATEAMPAHVKGWLNDYEKQILFYRNHTSSPSTIQANPNEDPIAQQWALLLGDNPSIPPLNTAIAPLLSTTWGQDPYYNFYCPYNASTGENSPTGCVATAIAQVMKFWGHPTTGFGSHSYTPSSYPTQSANFGTTTYNWSLMPDALTSSSTTAEINEVATLMHHLGVALEMQYDVDVSNAYVYYQGDHTQASADNVLRNYFKYKPSLHQINIEDYTPASWSATLTSELAAGRPIIYSGSDPTGGHCFVCDGCDNSGLFHINWGWRGYCDGYYAIGHLNPTSGGTGGNSTYTFNLYNVAVIGIEPNNSFGSTTTVTVSSNNTAYGTAAGGGTFSGTNTQTVSLTATAAAGCRFTGWSDGYQFNPRSFYANGGNYSFVANFQPLSGDTLGYCQNYYIFGLRNTSGATKWGIKLPASVLTPNHDLTHISFYAVAAGNHTLTIYTGTSSPSTAAHTQTVYIPDSAVGSWHTIPLSSPVVIDGSRSVWIAFSYTGSSSIYPAAMSYYSGNRDGILWGSNLSPLTTWDYSFMIRGIFTDNTPPPPLGDTVSYCDDNPYVTSIGASGSGNIHWGIRLPSSMHQHRNYLTDVMVYVVEGVPHTLNIYQGNTTSSATLVASQSVNFSSSNVNSWHTIPIPNGVALNPNQPLWITFNATANLYPAATCAFNGDTNSSLISLNGSDWSSLATATGNSLNGSWMIRAILSLTPPAASVVITGPTEIGQDVPNTFSAAGPAGATYSWTLTGAIPATASGSTITATWHTPGTYNVIVAATTPSTTVYDTLTVTVQSCHVSSFPYTMGAEPTDNLNCWSFIDNDNDGHGWSTSFCPPDSAHSGSFAFTSASYINDIGVLHPDNWLVSPAIPITPGFTYSLTWFDRAFDINYPSDYYSVYISTTGNNVSDFTNTPLFQTTITSNNYTQRTLNLSSYAGQTVYLAFRHHNCSDQYCMILDDITISRTPIPTYTLTVLSANPTMGTVSGGGTYYAGTSATISATPNIGYHFVQWNDGDTHDTRTVTVNANATYTASFETDTIYYTLTVLSANPTMGTVSGSGTYPEGTNVTITASAFTGYHFLYWNDGNHDTICTVTLNADATYTATFAEDTTYYTLTVLSANPAMGTVSGSGTYPEGTNVTLTASAFTGYHFLYWNDGNHDTIRTVTVNADATYTATFAEDTTYYTLTVLSANPTMGTVSGSGTYPEGTNVTLTASALTGYHFLYWNDGNHDTLRTVTLNADATYTATFAEDTTYYTLTVLSANPAMGTVSGSGTYPEGTNVTISASAFSGYHFLYWNDGNHDTIRTVTLTADATYNATFAEDTTYYTLTVLSANPAMGTVSGSGTYPEGTNVTISASAFTGYHFLYWNDGNHDTIRTVTLTADATYTATFAEDTTYYTLTVLSTNPAMGTVSGSGTYPEGTNVTLTASAFTGYHFLYWNDGNHDTIRTVTLTADATYTATFAEDTTYYTLTVLSANPAMGTVSGSGTYPEGTNVTLTASAFTGYHFLYWNDGNHDTIRTVTLTANTTYTATFAEDTTYYTLTVLSANPAMGTVSGSGTYPEGTNVTISASAFTGYHFLYWNDGNHDTIRTVTLTADATYTATFAEDTTYYTLTVLSANPAMGTVSGSGTYPEGTNVTISASAFTGYHFIYWNDGNYDTIRTVTLNADATYTATFAEDTTYYTLTVLSANPTMGTVSGSGTYPEGTNVTISASAFTGYHFLYWNDGNHDTIRTVTLNADATYTATFEANPPESINNVSIHFTIFLFANSQILVEGATGYPIVVYDLMGRQIARVPAAKFTELLCLPHRGVYLVKVSTLPVQKIINM